MTSVYSHQTPANLCQAVNTLGAKKPGRVVRFERKRGVSTDNVRSRSALIAGGDARAPSKIAPSSRHRLGSEGLDENDEDVSDRTLAV
jgi:hypothetical protein